MNLYIIDDEYHCIDLLKSHIDHNPKLKLVGTSTNPLEGLKEIEELGNVDIVITDINMSEISGFEVASRLPENIKIIFSSADDYFSDRALNFRESDFLLKPVWLEHFQKVFKKYDIG